MAILDLLSGEVVARLEDHVDLATAASGPDGSLLVVSSADRGATVYRLADGGVRRRRPSASRVTRVPSRPPRSAPTAGSSDRVAPIDR